jgi:PKD repeat protein
LTACGRPHFDKTIQQNKAPVAQAGKDQTARPDQPIVFDGKHSTDPDGTIISYEWAFGDGHSKSGEEVQHQYPDEGIYSVILTVTDAQGLAASDTISVNISELNPIASFSLSADEIDTGEEVTFDASASQSAGAMLIYRWNFNDSTSQATGVQTTHVFDCATPDDCTYKIELEVQDEAGRTASTEKWLKVKSLQQDQNEEQTFTLSDVQGVYDLSYSPGSANCSNAGYTISPGETNLTITTGSNSALCTSDETPIAALGGSGQAYTGCFDGQSLSLGFEKSGIQTTSTCVATLKVNMNVTLLSAGAFNGNVSYFYDAMTGCQCSKIFQIEGSRQAN